MPFEAVIRSNVAHLPVLSWFLRSMPVSRTYVEQNLHQYFGVDFQYSVIAFATASWKCPTQNSVAVKNS